MTELYQALINNLNVLCKYKSVHYATPNGLTTTISMLYLLVKNNPELLLLEVNGKKLYDYLFELSKTVYSDAYADFCYDENKNATEYTIDMFIVNDLMHKKMDYRDYYCSNDAYDLYGITMIQLKDLLVLSKPATM